MPVCKKCNAECKEGDKICSGCGSPLTGEDLRLAIHEEVEPAHRFICPKCRIIYEHGDTCIRCGSPIVEQTHSAKGEEPPPPFPHEMEKEEPSLSSATEAERKESEARPTPEAEKKTMQKQVPPQRSLNRLPRDRMREVNSSKRKGKRLLHLSREAASILILIGTAAYLCWSIYSNFVVKQPEASTALSKEGGTPVFPSSSATVRSTPPVTEIQEENRRQAVESPPVSQEGTAAAPQTASPAPSSSPPPVTDVPEVEDIKNLLKNIQQGNLRKDIDLFMSCYSPAFKGREGKRKETLENWEHFNYFSLSYDLKNPSISGQIARGRVEWRITFTPKAGGRTQESQTVLDVTFKREEDGWKITEVKPVS